MEGALLRERAARTFVRFLQAIAGALALATLLGWCARLWWPFDILTYPRWQYFFSSVLLALALAILRCFRWASLAGAIALVHALRVVPVFWGGTPAPAGSVLRVMTVNVLTGNHRPEDVIAEVRKVDPHVLLVLEASDRWLPLLAPLEASMRQVLMHPGGGTNGAALYARIPYDNERFEEFGEGKPSPVATFEWDGRTFTFVGTHPSTPRGAEQSRRRNDQLAAIARYVGSLDEPAIVAGDFNLWPWSPHFRDLLSDGGLRDSRRGHGVHTTAPVGPRWSGLSWLLQVPIDHLLHSDEFCVAHRELGGDTGSDHLAVIVDLGFCQLYGTDTQ